MALEDLDEEEQHLIRDILKYTAVCLSILLVFAVLFMGCAGCVMLVAVVSAA